MGRRHARRGTERELTEADRRAAAARALDHDDLEAFWAALRDERDATYQAARDVRRALYVDRPTFDEALRRGQQMVAADTSERKIARRRYYSLSERALPAPGLDLLRATPPGPAPEGLGPLLAWLEEDPFARWTGFEKQTVLRLLRRFTFDEPTAERLRQIILAMLQRGPRQEFREVRRLARVVDSAAFRSDLARLAASVDRPGVAERARLTLGLCERRPLPDLT